MDKEYLKSIGLDDELADKLLEENTDEGGEQLQPPLEDEASEEPAEQAHAEAPEEGSDPAAAYEQLFGEKLQEPVEESATEPDYKALHPQVEAQLADRESRLQRLLQSNPVNSLPKTGIYEKDGKTIYDMSDEEIRDYAQELEEVGRTADMHAVLLERRLFQEKAMQWYSEYERTYHERNDLEWDAVASQVLSAIPQLVQHKQKLAEMIGGLVNTAEGAELAKTRQGKMRLVNEAIKRGKFLAGSVASNKAQSPEKGLATGSKPGGSAVSSALRVEDLDKMSIEDILKRKDDVDKLLRA